MDAALSAHLDGIGIAAPARAMLETQGGVTNLDSFMEIKTTEFEEVWESLTSAAHAMRPANEQDRPVFSWTAKRRLHAFRLHCEFREISRLQMANLQTDVID